jgi:hypothetical protein
MDCGNCSASGEGDEIQWVRRGGPVSPRGTYAENQGPYGSFSLGTPQPDVRQQGVERQNRVIRRFLHSRTRLT